MGGRLSDDLRSAAPAASSLAREHEHLIGTGVDEFLGDHPVVLNRLEEGFEIAPNALMAEARFGQIGEFARPVPLDFRIEELAEVGKAARKVIQDSLYHLV